MQTDFIISEFYISDCFATDGKVAPKYSQKLAEDGCAVQFQNSVLQNLISPALSSDSKTLTFNQFGFIGESDAVALYFELNCIVRIGTAPACSSNELKQSRTRLRTTNATNSDRVAGKVSYQTQIDSTSGSQRIENLALTTATTPQPFKMDESSAVTISASIFFAIGFVFLL